MEGGPSPRRLAALALAQREGLRPRRRELAPAFAGGGPRL